MRNSHKTSFDLGPLFERPDLKPAAGRATSKISQAGASSRAAVPIDRSSWPADGSKLRGKRDACLAALTAEFAVPITTVGTVRQDEDVEPLLDVCSETFDRRESFIPGQWARLAQEGLQFLDWHNPRQLRRIFVDWQNGFKVCAVYKRALPDFVKAIAGRERWAQFQESRRTGKTQEAGPRQQSQKLCSKPPNPFSIVSEFFAVMEASFVLVTQGCPFVRRVPDS
jgi:hypothetical protein